MKEKITVEKGNMELAEKVIGAIGNYIVKESTKFIKTLFTTDEDTASETTEKESKSEVNDK